MSLEMHTTLVTAAVLLISLAGGFGWMIHRMDASEIRLATRIEAVDEGLSRRIEAVDAKLSEQIFDARQDLTDVKVSVARRESPSRPPLILAR